MSAYTREIWKDVVGYENIYEVSNQGRVRSSKDKTTKSVLHGTRKWRQRVLQQKISKDNTCRVSLYINKREKTHLVHQLVANAFIPKIEGKEFINHIDGNRLNNFVENLEWCTYTENSNHAFDSGLMPTNDFIILENLITGELLKFRSKVKTSEYLGRSQSYIQEQIKKGNHLVDHYVIYTTKMKNNKRVSFIGEGK